jgi:hypothetical protein
MEKGISRYFTEEDPRVEGRCLYLLSDIIDAIGFNLFNGRQPLSELCCGLSQPCGGYYLHVYDGLRDKPDMRQIIVER